MLLAVTPLLRSRRMNYSVRFRPGVSPAHPELFGPDETENKVRLGLQGSLDPKKTLQNSLTSAKALGVFCSAKPVLLSRKRDCPQQVNKLI
jgi:hypothetical protein